jgi:hypothetical protein
MVFQIKPKAQLLSVLVIEELARETPRERLANSRGQGSLSIECPGTVFKGRFKKKHYTICSPETPQVFAGWAIWKGCDLKYKGL